MTFTRQDLVTFLIGLTVALGVTVGQALVTLEPDVSLGEWARNLLIGLGTSTGRYLLTELAQRRVS